ncbi:PspC domain-containing protein [Ligilactobacillus sp. WILCCON 0076]|uniref:PspC domain-containing protein n=1 Tax=Ligilactobacillus ubinensis TaxID=2876789 RepID=A0A9X2FIX9_9LACO|nr:PspC domain-containing protein [Ligilactobacillus ubinensis]MCP0886355.1 PspC domain-containing protein [Ligilactobacillus ubinensis]
MRKKLYRSHNRLIAGVCAGLAEYFNIATKNVRIGFMVCLVLCSFIPHLIVLPIGIYAILALALPLNPNQKEFSWFSLLESMTGFSNASNNGNETKDSRKQKKKSRKIITNVREKDLH